VRQAPAAAAPENRSASAPAAAAGPTPEQRQRMLDAVAADPAQLERRKRFLEALDRGDPQALERWQQMQQRRAQQGGATAQ
jgi:multidrug efflux system membrane fusion protein